MKKLLAILVLGLLWSGNAYAEKKTWICQSERFGNFIWIRILIKVKHMFEEPSE